MCTQSSVPKGVNLCNKSKVGKGFQKCLVFTFMQLSNGVGGGWFLAFGVFFFPFLFYFTSGEATFFSFVLASEESVLEYLVFKGIVAPDSETGQIWLFL